MSACKLACALALLALAGCCTNPHFHSGELVTNLDPGDTPDVDRAPYKATYALYRWRKPPEGTIPVKWIPEQEVDELYVRGLCRFDKIGFERDADGKLFAVAGDEKIPLEDGRYCWHITPETEYRGMERILHETGENIVGLVSLPFAIVGAVIVLPMAGAAFLLYCCT
jgi:hypothetical protein